MKKFRLNKSDKKKWVEALRSGKYKQGQGYLYNEGLHCCLGVACEIGLIKYSGAICLSTEAIPGDIQGKLITFNDKKNRSFNWIAGYIERYL